MINLKEGVSVLDVQDDHFPTVDVKKAADFLQELPYFCSHQAVQDPPLPIFFFSNSLKSDVKIPEGETKSVLTDFHWQRI